MPSPPTLTTATRPASAPVHLLSSARYVITGVAGFFSALLLLGALWLFLRCRRRGRKPRHSSEQWIPFRPTTAITGSPAVRKVQPMGGGSLWTDLKDKTAPDSGTFLVPKPVGASGRRQSVPVLPSVYAAHAVSAMDFTKRRFSVVSDQEGASSDADLSPEPARRVSASGRPRRRSSTCPPPGEVDRHMYGYGPEASLNAHGLGKLCFSLSYNRELEVLYVKIHRAAYLSVTTRAKEYGDFHVELVMRSGEEETEQDVRKTRTVRSIRNPIFEQEFSFNATPDQLGAAALEFLVKERRQTVVGSVTFPLQDLDQMLRDENANLHSVWRDIARLEKEAESVGEVYISLSYNPHNSRLSVGIVKCRNLGVSCQETGIFCRLTVMSAEKVLKDERSRIVKKGIRCPLVEQEFHFGIDKSLMNNICLAITVWGKRGLGFNSLIGKCVLGPVTYSDGEGLLHWSTMMHEPRKTIHQWHSLK